MYRPAAYNHYFVWFGQSTGIVRLGAQSTHMEKPLTENSFVKEAQSIEHWIARRVKTLAFPDSYRNKVAAGLLHYSLELQTSFFLLVEHNLIGSAYALMRPIYETYVRAVWLHEVATDEDLEQFRKDNAYRVKNPKTGRWTNRTLDQIILDIEHIDSQLGAAFSRIKTSNWKVMNSLIHGGAEQIFRRISGDSIQGVQAEPQELRRVCGFISSFSLLAAMKLAQMAENEAFALEIGSKLRAC